MALKRTTIVVRAALRDNPGATVVRLSELTGLGYSTIALHLKELHELGEVFRHGTVELKGLPGCEVRRGRPTYRYWHRDPVFDGDGVRIVEADIAW